MVATWNPTTDCDFDIPICDFVCPFFHAEYWDDRSPCDLVQLLDSHCISPQQPNELAGLRVSVSRCTVLFLVTVLLLNQLPDCCLSVTRLLIRATQYLMSTSTGTSLSQQAHMLLLWGTSAPEMRSSNLIQNFPDPREHVSLLQSPVLTRTNEWPQMIYITVTPQESHR
jgi:hypothetical protein